MQETRTEQLSRAIAYETEHCAPKEAKPLFHVTPPVGWINDPNGFSYYKGEYHLFYQYHPYSTQWGPMHWGHCKTKDFVVWEQLPCALAPDTAYDGQGCFSGSAVEHEGKHILMYTGVSEKQSSDGRVEVLQTQSIAVGDGISYVKYENNPVITAEKLPKGSSAADFRDPKIWKEQDSFYAVIGSKDTDGNGQIALFSSKDAYDWKFEKMLDYCKGEYGKMWECPDFFELDGHHVLLVSPQFMQAQGLEFHSGNGTVYFIGNYDRESFEFTRGNGCQVDYGMDFYAPQTIQAADGRRIMIGWLQNWDNYITPEESEWSGMMTIPRELSVKDGKLVQVPVRELENYHNNRISYRQIKLSENQNRISLDGIKGRCLDMTIDIESGDFEEFHIELAADEKNCTRLSYDRKKKIITTDRTYSGLRKDVITSRSMYVRETDHGLRLRVLLDKYCIELFVNDGEQAMTSLVYTPLSAENIYFSCDSNAVFSITKYEIKMPE
ncbi:MAG: glycoside hydrolase family 32 protein [Lachnospiraceae bacterium]|nr:glycoside hydrolase family 32 protein [Lachnospiraceae bacterium]